MGELDDAFVAQPMGAQRFYLLITDLGWCLVDLQGVLKECSQSVAFDRSHAGLEQCAQVVFGSTLSVVKDGAKGGSAVRAAVSLRD